MDEAWPRVGFHGGWHLGFVLTAEVVCRGAAFVQFTNRVLVSLPLAVEVLDAEDIVLLELERQDRVRSQRVTHTQRFLLSTENHFRVKLLAAMMELLPWLPVMLLAASSDSASKQAATVTCDVSTQIFSPFI